MQIKERLVLLDVGEPLVPVCLLNAAEFLAFNLGDDLGSGVWKRRSRRQFGQRLVHRLGNEFLAQTMLMLRPALFRYPAQEAPRSPVAAMTVEAGIGAVQRMVTAHRIAVAMLRRVRADDAKPSLGVAVLDYFASVVHPLQHVVLTVIVKRQLAAGACVRVVRGNAKSVADFLQGEHTLRRMLCKIRREVIPTVLQIDRTRQTEVTHRIDSAGVCVARLGDGDDSRRELALGWLLVQLERVTPLVIALRCLHLPCRLKRRRLALRADVVKHHERYIVAVGRACVNLAIGEPVEDKRRGVGVPCALASVFIR